MQEIFDIRKIGDFFTDAIFICDENGIIRYVNKENERISGIDRDMCIGHHVDEFVGKDSHVKNVVTMKLLNGGKAYVSFPSETNKNDNILEAGSPVFSDSGELIGAVIIDHDMSSLTNLEQTLRSSKVQISSLEELNINHEQYIAHVNQTHMNSYITNWKSPVMKKISQTIESVAKTDVTVLLQGETGVGKEVFARDIVNLSDRRDNPFVRINCAAIPRELIESELFGYEKGSFTGADPKGRKGAFEFANKGTLFLDEIGEIPIEFQTKLLRAIQEREITRIGSQTPISVDFRLIAATNQDLKEKVSAGTFRADLYYRLNVVPLSIPPLRDRQEDIALLIEYFLEKNNFKYKKNIHFERSAIMNMQKYSWPGNIREMENMIERWCILFPKNAVIGWDDIYQEFGIADKDENDFENHTMRELIENQERKILIWGYMKYGSLRKMAQKMDVHYSTLSKMCKRLDLDIQDLKKGEIEKTEPGE